MSNLSSVAQQRTAAGPVATPKPQLRVAYAPEQESNTPASYEEGTLIAAHRVTKAYRKGNLQVPVLKGVDFAVEPGEFVAIIGQSGSGKSTLLHLLGTLDKPDAGEIHFAGKRIDQLPARERDQIRNRSLGMIFQFYHLLPELSTLENVLTPIMIQLGLWSYWTSRAKYVERAKHLLELVGMSHRLNHKPCELSGGEMQRTAIARALMANPVLLLADEPTGNLDSTNGREVLALLRRLNQEEGLSVVMVTHDDAIAQQADRTVKIVEGLVVER
jgi:lipoprotein-releasing system ATP-binding protein